ncbi:MAG: methionyl-tRNA formyltransferase [Eubacteriales bacterium]|nr:methionyl-tRNA formyltransferase [Eubacteriales bacterium]
MKRVAFIGSKELGFSVLKKLFQLNSESIVACITYDDRDDTRSYYDEYCSFCEKEKIPIFILSKAREMNKVISDIKPDLCFVLGWYYLIDQEVIDSVPMGFIGVHNSLLPKYRGFAPLVWTMINGEKKAGFSLFSFTDKMDEGDIWATGEVEIASDDYISDVIEKINKELLNVLDEVYLLILQDEIKPYKQKNEDPSYGAKRIEEDGLINWNMSATKVYDFIRAQSIPYPGAYTYFNGKKITVWKAKRFDYVYYGTPGQMGMFLEEGILVVCGDSKGVVITEVEYEGERKNIKDIIKSLNVRFESLQRR